MLITLVLGHQSLSQLQLPSYSFQIFRRLSARCCWAFMQTILSNNHLTIRNGGE